MYEMAAGYPPFFADQPIQIYEKIVSGRVSRPGPKLRQEIFNILNDIKILYFNIIQKRYPNHFSPELRDLLKHLLEVCVLSTTDICPLSGSLPFPFLLRSERFVEKPPPGKEAMSLFYIESYSLLKLRLPSHTKFTGNIEHISNLQNSFRFMQF